MPRTKKNDTGQIKKINTAYVFSENNQVFVKKQHSTTRVIGHKIYGKEWYLTRFQWENI